MKSLTNYVGLHVHKDAITMAVAVGEPGLDVDDIGRMPHDIARVIERIARLGPPASLHVADTAPPSRRATPCAETPPAVLTIPPA